MQALITKIGRIPQVSDCRASQFCEAKLWTSQTSISST
jgi:hypothetical protein